ncbi:hypothetical protein E3T29_18315 [Cryobacterium sp. TMT1-66-1]|nr:hypothetical protein E3T29_18315 [Cryobacterium sp. TMT1-66-1]
MLILRDRTELHQLMQDLDGARDVTKALRAQAHEFANTMHMISGLIELGRTEQIVDFVTRFGHGGSVLSRRSPPASPTRMLRACSWPRALSRPRRASVWSSMKGQSSRPTARPIRSLCSATSSTTRWPAASCITWSSYSPRPFCLSDSTSAFSTGRNSEITPRSHHRCSIRPASTGCCNPARSRPPPLPPVQLHRPFPLAPPGCRSPRGCPR